MANAAATKIQRRRRAAEGKAADGKGVADGALTAAASEVGGMKVDRALEKRVDHISAEEAERQGKTARVAVPRTLHAAWAASAGRRSPVDIIAEQATTREPDLVPIRHGRMMVSPFTFYRGAAAVMAADLGGTPSSGMRVQCCGDAHLLNFGGFTSPERSMLFDVNDFDETLPGPWEWDVKRLAASIEVAGRDGQLKPVDRRNAVEATARQYREAMRDFATLTELGVWYSRLDGDSLVALVRAEVGAKEAPNLEANLAKARSKDSMKAFTKLTQLLDGEPIITADPPLIVPLRDLIDPEVLPKFQDELHKLFRAYRRHAPARPAALARAVPDRGHGQESGRGGQRRDPLLGPAAHGPARRRPDIPPGQRGPGLGARSLLRQEQDLQPGPAGGGRPAPHAGRQ